MIIEIDGKNLDITLENEETAGEVVLAVEKWLESGNLFVSGIKIDGKTIASGMINEAFKQKITEIDKIELFSASKNELIDVAISEFKNLEEKLPDLRARLSDFSLNMQTGDEKKASQTLQYFSDFSSKLLLLTKELLTIPEEADEKNGRAIDTVYRDGAIEKISFFCTIMKDLFSAYENKDMVLTGDLCEYEICPALTQVFEAAHSYIDKIDNKNI